MAPSQHYVHEIERNLLAIKSNISSLLLQQICEPLHVGTSLHSTGLNLIIIIITIIVVIINLKVPLSNFIRNYFN
jgi:hypothetical protein